ncbi:hypothetical protein [Streptomyces viridosporus]
MLSWEFPGPSQVPMYAAGTAVAGASDVPARLRRRAHLAVQPLQFRLLVDDLVQQRRRGVAGEGRPARRRVRQHRARGEDVRRARDALAEDLLGGM